MQIYKIPLISTPQKFTLNMAGVDYIVKNTWNTILNCWLLSMQYAETQDFVFDSLPLVAGVDLLMQYQHLNIGGRMLVYTDGDVAKNPTIDNLGNGSNLYFLIGTLQ
jgi:hypothetical protein